MQLLKAHKLIIAILLVSFETQSKQIKPSGRKLQNSYALRSSQEAITEFNKTIKYLKMKNGMQDGIVSLYNKDGFAGQWTDDKITQMETPSSFYTGNGNRIKDVKVEFKKPFDCVPKIVVSVIEMDISLEKNSRHNARAKDITSTGFTMEFQTWSDSKMMQIGASYLAHC